MPIDYKNYPSNWKTEIRPAILKRADNKCEFCGLENYSFGVRDKNGVFKKTKNGCLKIVLTIAHLDHDTTNNSYDNLKALCQKCHLNYYKHHHAENARNTRNKKKKQISLF